MGCIYDSVYCTLLMQDDDCVSTPEGSGQGGSVMIGVHRNGIRDAATTPREGRWIHMRSRERVEAALKGQPVDRIPHNFRAWGNVLDLLCESLALPDRDSVLEWAQSDFRDLGGLGSFLKPGVGLETGYDIWGVRRETREGEHGSYAHIVHSPLAGASNMDDARAYQFPDAHELFDFSGLPDAAKSAGRDGEYFLFMEVESVFDRTWAVRGMENLLVDLIADEEMAHYMIGQNARFFYERTRMLLEAGRGAIDCVGLFDDFGTQEGLLISPEMYRRFVKPHQVDLIRLAHEHGAQVFYHSCGCVAELYPEFVEIGVDIIDPLQLSAMKVTAGELRRRFPHANLHGGLDTQHILPFGSPAQIFAEVRSLIDALGQGGHYVFSTTHNIQGGVPVANLCAMVSAVHETQRQE